MCNKEIIITFALSKGTRSLTIKKTGTMPTRKEAEEYKRKLERIMVRIAESDLPDRIKDEMLNEALDKWKAAHEALLGIGLPLEED